MSDFASNVVWNDTLRLAEAGKLPQCLAISAPLKYHLEIVESMSRVILGTYRPNHPDLLMIGTLEKPPLIGDPEKPNYEGTCRWLSENILLKPMESTKRLGIIFNGDKLSKSAGNSLLKLTEEPPEHVNLIYLMEDSNIFLPTLRSRTSLITITVDEAVEPKRMPLDAGEWAMTLASLRKSTPEKDTITPELEAWGEYALSTGNMILAEKIEKLRIISSRKNLSTPMLCDLIIMTLMEGYINIEYILDDIR